MNGQQSYKDTSDEELLELYRSSGDNNILGSLLQRYTVLLLGVAMKYLKDKVQAQDAVQQVFLKTLTSLPKGEIQNFKGWLYILMRNHCFQLLRDRSYHASDETLSYLPDEEKVNEKELIEKDIALDQMQEALQELNEEQKTALTLFYLKKMSYQQIMEQTGLSFMQVKSYIQNGKRNLKQLLIKKMSGRQT